MSNPFEELAERQIPGPRKSVLKGVETRAQKKAEKALVDRDILFTQWKKWHEERKATLLDGPHAEVMAALCNFLENMTLEDGPRLIKFLKSRSSFRKADRDTRFEALSLISTAIVYLREKVGLHPFDDPLPGDEPDLFQLIKQELVHSENKT